MRFHSSSLAQIIALAVCQVHPIFNNQLFLMKPFYHCIISHKEGTKQFRQSGKQWKSTVDGWMFTLIVKLSIVIHHLSHFHGLLQERHSHLSMRIHDSAHKLLSISCHVFDNCIGRFHNLWCSYTLWFLAVHQGLEPCQWLLDRTLSLFSSSPILQAAFHHQNLSMGLSAETPSCCEILLLQQLEVML